MALQHGAKEGLGEAHGKRWKMAQRRVSPKGQWWWEADTSQQAVDADGMADERRGVARPDKGSNGVSTGRRGATVRGGRVKSI
jgi:hypothetical protein